MPALKIRNSHLNAPDYGDRVNLIKKIKTCGGWRFAPVVPEANGRLKDRVRIDGQIEVHTDYERVQDCGATLVRDNRLAQESRQDRSFS